LALPSPRKTATGGNARLTSIELDGLKKAGFEKALVGKQQYKQKRNEADDNEN
jgi:hypothetical protein